MENILSYLKWRGDISFAERPFCEVDNLILSELAYLDFKGILPSEESQDEIPVKLVQEKMKEAGRKGTCAMELPEDFLQVFAQSRRFGTSRLSHFTDVLNEKTQTQFSAVQIHLEDGSIYIAFRGTGDELVGWREDFSMSYRIMPSQRLAAEYLKRAVADPHIRYRTGGHSKGGNLAVYAAMCCSGEQQAQIERIYSNDGPGFCPDIIDMERYDAIRPKICRIVPEFSVVGALFEQGKPDLIVCSTASGLMQHDGFSWQIEGDHFVTCEALSRECRLCNDIFDTWIESAAMEQRETFTRDFFDALGAGGAKTISELSANGIDSFESVLIALARSESRTKLMFAKLAQSIVNTLRPASLLQTFRSRATLQGMLCLFMGLLFMTVPESASKGIAICFGAAALFFIGRRLMSCAMAPAADALEKRCRLILHMLSMCLLVVLLCQSNILTGFTNLLLCGFFLWTACSFIRRSAEKNGRIGRAFCLLTAGISFALGIIPVTSASLELSHYAFTAGTFLLLAGAVLIAREAYKNGADRGRTGNQRYHCATVNKE